MFTGSEIEVLTSTDVERYDLQALVDEATEYIESNRSQRTRNAYASDFAQFEEFCEEKNVSALPASPETVALFLTDQARTLKASTVNRRASAISSTHKMAGHESPCQNTGVRELLKGIRRKAKDSKEEKDQIRKAAPARIGEIRRMISHIDRETTVGRRDAALLLVGFAAALRRSELAMLTVDDIEHVEGEGVSVNIRYSKTDQEGKGRKVAIPFGADQDTCPVAALTSLTDDIGHNGPLFRRIDQWGNVADTAITGRAVSIIIKRSAQAAGLNPDDYSGHSLRAGFATTAAANGANEREIAKVTGHQSMAVLGGYIREGALFRNTAAGKVGL